MAETIRSDNGIQKWHWFDVAHDLKEQGGLPNVVVDPLTVTAYGCGGETKEGTKFYITWIHDVFLLLSVSQEQPALVEAFAKVVEYRPFCRYIDENGLLTFEWDKKDLEGRFTELQKQGALELQRVS